MNCCNMQQSFGADLGSIIVNIWHTLYCELQIKYIQYLTLI